MSSRQDSPLGYPAHQPVTLNHCLFLQQTKGSIVGLQPPRHMCYAARSRMCAICIYCKNYRIISTIRRTVREGDYDFFSTGKEMIINNWEQVFLYTVE